MIVFDVETSGLDPYKNTILSIGAYDTRRQDSFYEEIRAPEWADISPRALKVNGFTKEEIYSKDRTPLEKAINDFLAWSGRSDDRVLAGWNVHFDIGFLQAALMRLNIKWPFGFRYIDIHGVAYLDIYANDASSMYHYRTVEGLSKLSLNGALKFYGLPPEPNPHNALTGAKAGAAVLLSSIQRRKS